MGVLGDLRSLADVARVWVEQGGGVLPVSGRSMRPTFEDATRVWLERPSRVRFGDVLVYSNGEFLIVHRVVGFHRGRHYRTKGDGLPHLDQKLVPHDRALGRVVRIERDGDHYRTDRAGGRLYAVLVGVVSGFEGFLYRFAWRADWLLTPRRRPSAKGGGRTPVRRALMRAGRAAIGLVDRTLFRRLHLRDERPP